MGSAVICQICGEKFTVLNETERATILGQHLMEKHPSIEMAHFSKDNLCQCCTEEEDLSKKQKQNESLKSPCSCPAIENQKKPRSSCIFKTTVETWRQATVRVLCPKCNTLDRPCIRRQRNRVAHSPLGALCLLICWPVCFLPFLMPQGNRIDLFCRNCGVFLGQYDKKNGKLKCPPCPAVVVEDINVHTLPTLA